jgi:hypothetical protein
MRFPADGPLHYILDEHGDPEPCNDVIRWARWFETADRRVCADLDEGDPERRVMVSTVFLGLDHDWTCKGPPVLWESLVFAPDVPQVDGLMRRYSSRDAAILGHQDICEQVMRALREARAEEPYQ